MKRSRFLLGAAGGLAVSAKLDSVFARALAAPALPGLPGSANDRVLVVVNLQGGNDGLNTIVPHGMPAYYQARPTIAVHPNDVLAIDGEVGFNPALRSLKSMYDRGQVAIVQGVGYPHPDHSHFRSTAIWQTAEPDRVGETGWLGRFLDETSPGGRDLFDAVAVAPVRPEVLAANHSDVPALVGLKAFGLKSDRDRALRSAFPRLIADDALPFRSPYLATVAQIEAHAEIGAHELPQLVAGYSSQASYPATELGQSLALAAQLIGSRAQTRVIYVQQGSYDTHVSQQGTQQRLLAELDAALAAFYADLTAHGNDRRTLTMTFSEFGRRVAENANAGTDHGEAAPLFVIGGGIKGGLYGEHPSLANLDDGDTTFTTDFRSVYATVVERWFGRPSEGIIAGSFPAVPLLA